jgi:hypothetical protein
MVEVKHAGGKFVAPGVWQSEGAATDPKWSFYLNGEDLSVYKSGAPGSLIVKGFKTMTRAKLGLNLQAPEALVQPGALVGDYAVKTEVATSDLKRTHRDGGSVTNGGVRNHTCRQVPPQAANEGAYRCVA